MKKILLLICVFLIGLTGICTPADEKRIIGKQGVSRGIMVYIPKHEDNAKMKQAFMEWTKATNGKITFKFISSPKTSQIQVYFVDTVQNYDNDAAIGLASSQKVVSGAIKHTAIQISKRAGFDGAKDLTEEEEYLTMIHEIGHALGLGHSNDPTDVMYPVNNGLGRITEDDINLLYQIYKFK